VPRRLSAASLPARLTDDFAAMLLSSSSVTLADGWLKSGTTLTSDDLAIGLGRVRLADGFAVQSRRRRARRVATERYRTEVETHLDEARRSTAARRAYESFERAVEVITSTSDNASLAPLLSYLGDDDAPYRDTLLSCLADRDVPLLDAPAIKRVASLLSHQNRELARSAALALTAGGERATEGLQVALGYLDASRRADLERLLSFAVT